MKIPSNQSIDWHGGACGGIVGSFRGRVVPNEKSVGLGGLDVDVGEALVW